MKREELKHYLTKHVAQILFDTVEHAKPEERALDDWTNAEKIVGQQFGLDLDRWEFDTRGQEPSFGEFTAKYGNVIWMRISRNTYRQQLPRPPYGGIVFS